MREQWEYKLLVGRDQFGDPVAGVEFGPLGEELLNKLGKEGWEVCAYTCTSAASASLILKRKVLSD